MNVLLTYTGDRPVSVTHITAKRIQSFRLLYGFISALTKVTLHKRAFREDLIVSEPVTSTLLCTNSKTQF
jgi:hypothetical protein